MDAVADRGGVLVGVDRDLVVEVEDGLDRDVAVAQPCRDLPGQERADVLDPGHGVVRADRVLTEVDVEDDPALGAAAGGLVEVTVAAREQVEQLGGAGEPAERLGPQDVTGGVTREAPREEVGDALDHGVDPDGVACPHSRDEVAQAELVGLRERDVAPLLLLLQQARVAGRVGLDDLGPDDLDQPAGGDLGQVVGERGVDDHDAELVERPAEDGGLACQPGLEVELLDGAPPPWQAVAQVEGVGDHRTGGVVVDAAGDRQLGEAELLHQRCAVAADLDQPVLALPDPASARTELGVGGVEVGPVGGQRQVARFRGAAGHDLALDGRQGGGRTEGVDVGEDVVRECVEHVFENRWAR